MFHPLKKDGQPSGQMNFQMILHRDRFPPKFGQNSREFAYQNFDKAMAHVRSYMDAKFGHVFIYEHCLPFDVTRAVDEAKGIKHPRIWTAERDAQLWQSLAGEG